MRTLLRICVLAVAVAGAGAPAGAWEPETTHAGLTERAALHARLHAFLRDHLGMAQGLFAALTVPPADAPALFEVLGALDPIHGYVPDTRGRMLALSWLSAGAVIADVPVEHAIHHFFDPATGRGLDDGTMGWLGTRLGHELRARVVGADVLRSGRPAPDWVLDPANPMGLESFLSQYERAVRAPTPAERERHLASALLAAGAMLHVLQDMGSPSHARNDLAAHLDVVGPDGFDRGSRFERIAALAYGRLGVPAPDPGAEALPDPGSAGGLRGLFTSEAGTGLADRTARRWFSAHTLPPAVRVRAGMGSSEIAERLRQGLARPAPAPPRRLDLEAAHAGGARLLDDAGVCLASYRIDAGDLLTWSLDDACASQQIAAILPVVGAYSAALLDWLFRGAVDLAKTDAGLTASARGAALGAGTLTLLWEDEGGARAPLGAPVQVTGAGAGAVLAKAPAPPQGARAVVAVFRGVDAQGQPLVAAGHLSL